MATSIDQRDVPVREASPQLERSSASGRRIRAWWVRPVLMGIRRSHLYLGLLLVPWALLYGISAYLFNHPTHFSDGKLVAFGASPLQDTPLAIRSNARADAARVVEEVNKRFAGTKLTLEDVAETRYEGDTVGLGVNSEEISYRAFVRIDGTGGMARPQDPPKNPSKLKAPFEILPSQVPMPSPSIEQVEVPPPLKIEGSLAARSELATETIFKRLQMWPANCQGKVMSVPELVFFARDADQLWEVRYNSLSGVLTARPKDSLAKSESSFRRFLLRLHTAHGYPGSLSARWIWAVLVDLMAAVMVFWGLSGLVMWWQIKSTRPAGTVVMIVSLISAAVIGYQMWLAFGPTI